ncbi:hypothetical protein Pyn_13466 [Prunus yedoensis var. nudiflora]|uniref:WAT1-related protein n=1 Tax=Prunus yedoensis var. nudiflora TaxID=2094558 RepID=A0A314UHJ1_PRUYE|nr:hypothetical protein Pyn_13466 [Prunus yedoensis var. nudiflora]
MATEVGMNLTVLVAYRNMFSAALMVPAALIIERATISQNFYVQSVALTSTTSATAITNLVPAITFVIAICFRLERLALGTHAGRAKVVGTLVGIGGTMVFTFYKGKEIAIWSKHVNLLHDYTHQNSHGVVTTGLVFTVIAWCVQMRGPLFVSIFNPLCFLLVALSGSLFLHEKLYLGRQSLDYSGVV